MPALVSLTQEELDALAAEQAAQDAVATAPVPPPYDPAQDTQGMQAQPAAIAVAPPEPYVDPATSADASRSTGYDVAPAPVYQEVAPPQEYTTQTTAPAPVAEPAAQPPVQGATQYTAPVPMSTSEAAYSDPNYRTFTPSNVLTPVAAPPPATPFAPRAHQTGGGYGLGAMAGGMWDPNARWGHTDITSPTRSYEERLKDRTWGLGEGSFFPAPGIGAALGLEAAGEAGVLRRVPEPAPYPVVETRPGVRRVITREGGVTLPIKSEASTGARPAQYGPGLRPSGGMSAENPGYVGIRPRVEPDIIPEPAPANAPVPAPPPLTAPKIPIEGTAYTTPAGRRMRYTNGRWVPESQVRNASSPFGEHTVEPTTTEAQLIAERAGRRAGNAPRPIVDPQSPAALEAGPRQPGVPETGSPPSTRRRVYPRDRYETPAGTLTPEGEAAFREVAADQATRVPVSEPRPVTPGEGAAPATTPSGRPAPRRTPVEATAPVTEPNAKPTAVPADPTLIQHEGNWTWNPTERKWYDAFSDETVTPPAPTGRAAAPVQAPVLEPRTVTPAESARPTRVRVSKPVASQYEEARAALRADEPNVLTRKSQEWADLTSGPRQGPVLAEARPVAEPVDPVITEPVAEPAPGTANAQPPQSRLPVRTAKAVGRGMKAHPVVTGIVGTVLAPTGLAALNRAKNELTGAKPAGTTPSQVSGTQQTSTTGTTQTLDPMEQARRQGVPTTTERRPSQSVPGVDIVAEGSSVWGAIDENGNFVMFPDDMTPDEATARMQQIADANGSAPVAVNTVAAPNDAAPADEAATTPVDEPVQASGTAVPLSTITGSSDTGTTSSSGEPLLTSDGTDTGLTLNDDGTVSKSSGGGSGSGYYRKNYGSSGSSYRSSGSSRYSKKKKKGSSSSGFGSMFGDMFGEGFPFQRQNSPIRQLVLDAIANSLAEGQARKNAKNKK